MFDLLERVLKKTDCFTEIRHHNRELNSISVRKGELEESSSSIYGGVGIRVLIKGSWGFSSTNRLTENDIYKTFKEAKIAAEISSKNKKVKVKGLSETTMAVGEFEPEINDSLKNHSLDEKLSLVLKTEKLMRASSPLIQSAFCRYNEIIDEKYIVTSDGARCHILDMKPEFRLMAVAVREVDMTSAFKAIGVTGGWEDIFGKKKPEELAESTAKIAIDLLDAKYPIGERLTVILDPSLVGILSHEAIGHTVEADFVLAGSISQGKIGKKVASELITLIDSGHSQIKGHAGGELLVDDEGVPTKKTVIIKDGILMSYLHNRETSKIFDVEPTGNARAFEYSDEPLIRMRNTYIEPGNHELENMISEIKKGYLLKGPMSGQADANAEFMFGVQEAYEINNGKLGRLLKGATISGQAFDVLNSVDAVSKDFEWDLGSGYCGKKQYAKVDAGGPYLRCKLIIGGKQER